MSDSRTCIVCREPVESGGGDPCAVCGEWFHFTFSKAPGARRCGIFSGNVPGLVS